MRFRNSPSQRNNVPKKSNSKEFVALFQKVYASEDLEVLVDKAKIRDVPLFTLVELKYAIKKMRNRKSEDMFCIVAELIQHVDESFFQVLL